MIDENKFDGNIVLKPIRREIKKLDYRTVAILLKYLSMATKHLYEKKLLETKIDKHLKKIKTVGTDYEYLEKEIAELKNSIENLIRKERGIGKYHRSEEAEIRFLKLRIDVLQKLLVKEREKNRIILEEMSRTLKEISNKFYKIYKKNQQLKQKEMKKQIMDNLKKLKKEYEKLKKIKTKLPKSKLIIIEKLNKKIKELEKRLKKEKKQSKKKKKPKKKTTKKRTTKKRETKKIIKKKKKENKKRIKSKIKGKTKSTKGNRR